MWSTVFTTVVLNLGNVVSLTASTFAPIKLGSASFLTKSLGAGVFAKFVSPREGVLISVQVTQVMVPTDPGLVEDPVDRGPGLFIRAGSIKLVGLFTGVVTVEPEDSFTGVPVALSTVVQVVQVVGLVPMVSDALIVPVVLVTGSAPAQVVQAVPG